MNNALNYMEEILDHQICGFHQYVLTAPVHLNYVSRNLCELLDVEESELLDQSTDLYLHLVHPADRDKYSDFIQKIILKEQALTCEYRLVKRRYYDPRERYRHAQEARQRDSHRAFCSDGYHRS